MTAPPVQDPQPAFGCSVFDDEDSAHNRPSPWTCTPCGGTGLCPDRAGTGGDDLDWCECCDAAGFCPEGCADGAVSGAFADVIAREPS